MAGAINSAGRTAARPQTISWKGLLIIGVVPALIAIPAYYALIWMDQKDQQREIYKVDLNRESELPSGDVKFVQLTGVAQLDYQYQVEEKSNTRSSASANTYIPLTGSGWNKQQPIRFFMNATFTGYFNPKTKRSISFSEQGVAAATFDGKLTQNGLPTYVVNEYQRAGLRIDSPYYVMDRMSFNNGRIPSKAQSQQYYLIPILGVGLSLAILVGGSIGLGVRKFLKRDR